MKKFYVSICLSLVLFSSFSNPIDSTFAKKIAQNFLSEKMSDRDLSEIKVEKVFYDDVDCIPTIYYINFQQGGFVIVSGDEQSFPILGFDLTGTIDPNVENSPEFASWMNWRSSEIEYIRNNNYKGSATTIAEWERLADLKSGDRKEVNTERNVLPLLTTTWDQGCYYNDLCPAGNSCPCSKHWTGCVATAMAQMMKYHNFPAQGIGSHGYTDLCSNNYLFADFGNTIYNWEQMPDNLTSQNTAVATLMLHCGIAVNMCYDDCIYGSGANGLIVEERLTNYFNYLSTSSRLYKNHYNESDWRSVLRNELDSKRPMLYAASDYGVGHLFICDGYSGSDYFHFNWGWGGYANGYYYLDNLVAGGHNYTFDQEAIVGIQPDAQFAITTSPVPSTGGNTNGAGNYQSGIWHTVTATPNSGYNFSHWLENGNQISTNSNYSFMVSGNRSLEAIFNFGTPSEPASISGDNFVCQGQGSVNYSVPAIAEATSYIWTLPPGATGASSTNSITVNYGSSAVSGNISVRGVNSYGEGAATTMAVIVDSVPGDAENTDAFKQWSLQNPSPTAELISSIYFTDINKGYAVDGGGNIIKTTDGGATWLALWSGAYKGLNSVYFFDPYNGYAVGRKGVILKTDDGGNRWTALQSGTTYDLSSVFFTDVNTGYVVGQAGTILKTSNGGSSWSILTDLYNISYQTLLSVNFTSANTGFIAGSNGVILKTTNGGESWITTTNHYAYDLRSIYFVDTNIGYAVGGKWHNYQGAVLKTINGGITWDVIWTGEYHKLSSVFFTDANTGYATGDNGAYSGYIMKTTDGGTTWTDVWNSSKWMSSVYFTNNNTGFAVGQSGTLLKTLNGGTTWNNYGLNNDLLSAYFTDTMSGYAVGSGGSILKTENGGITWNAQSSGTDKNLSSVHFPAADTGYAVGGDGTILKTTNAGSSWTKVTIGANYLSSVYFTSSNIGYSVDLFGSIFKTTNGGADWIILSSNVYNLLQAVFFTDDNTGYIAGYGFILKTTNGGITWTSQSVSNDDLTSIHFPTANCGYALGSRSTILKTTNGGLTWIQLIAEYTFPLGTYYSIHFNDVNNGYVVGSYGRILVTSDGGYTWNELISGTRNDLYSVFSKDISTVYAVGQGGTILKYNNVAQTIAGPSTVCQGQENATYTVPIIENATSYVWTLPSGATGTSSTNSIKVDYSSNSGSGDITVYGQNDCGSGVSTTLEIRVISKPETPTINLFDGVLHSSAPIGNQWYNQNGIINGATNQEYRATSAGDYYVVVTINDCSSDPSNTINVTITGAESVNSNDEINIYPNPVSKSLTIEIEKNTVKVNFEIWNSLGLCVYRGYMFEKTNVLTEHFASGLYMVRFDKGTTWEYRKFVKE